jgi:hypothetical protein
MRLLAQGRVAALMTMMLLISSNSGVTALSAPSPSPRKVAAIQSPTTSSCLFLAQQPQRVHDFSLSFSTSGILPTDLVIHQQGQKKKQDASSWRHLVKKLFSASPKNSNQQQQQPLQAISSSTLGLEERAKQLQELAERVYDQEQAYCYGNHRRSKGRRFWKHLNFFGRNKERETGAGDVVASAIQAATDTIYNKVPSIPSQSLLDRAKRSMKSKLNAARGRSAVVVPRTTAPPLQVVASSTKSSSTTTTTSISRVSKSLETFTKKELEQQLQEKYKRIEKVEDRAFQILQDLGMAGDDQAKN